MACMAASTCITVVVQNYLPAPNMVNALSVFIHASGTITHSQHAGCLYAQGVEHNSEAALYAVSQGRGRSAGCVNLTAAETIAAQRCLRNPACSKALGHAGFCDNGKSASAMRHNSLAGLAAAAEQASNGSLGSTIVLAACTGNDGIASCIPIHQCGRPDQMQMQNCSTRHQIAGMLLDYEVELVLLNLWLTNWCTSLQ